MSSHFIKNITIENFKCFESLQIEGMERVNLIGGKNNVGKTAFLEAVELLVSANEPRDLAVSIYNSSRRRQTDSIEIEIDFIREKRNKIKISTDNKTCEIGLVEQEDLFNEKLEEETETIFSTASLSLTINSDKDSFPVEMFKHRVWSRVDIDNINFISTTKTEERDIAILYGALVDLDREDFLNNSLKIFDENLVSIKQRVTKRNVLLKLKLKDRQTPILLSSLGEGVNRYIAVLCAMWASKDGFLLIDEVENGIHYTNYKKLWQIIFQASAEANCQLFITSHSKECIEAFNKVQLEDENASGAYFEFYKNLKTDRITASKRDKEQLEYALTHQGRVRGE